MIRAIERATGVEYKAKAIEGGYKIYTLEGEPYKKLKESTFKRYFKVIKAEEPKIEEKKEEKKVDTRKNGKDKVKPESIVELDDVTRENMVEKIKKILNLGRNNPSQEEGMAAVLQAQKLMAKYNIHEDEVSLEEIKEGEISENTAELKHNAHLLAWYKTLARIVADNFRVKVYLDQNSDVVFRGFTEDTKIAKEAYLYLYTLGNRLAGKAYATAKENTGTAKGVFNSFVTGFLTGVKEALTEQCTALMLVTPKAVEEDFEIFSANNLEKGRKHVLRANQGKYFVEGKVEGKAAVKSKQLEEKKNKGGKR